MVLTQLTTYTATSKRYLRFAAVASLIFSLGFTLVNNSRGWTEKSLAFSFSHLLLSLVNARVTYQVLKKANQHKLVIGADHKVKNSAQKLSSLPNWHRPLGALLMLSVLMGNPFNLLSGLVLFFRKVQAYQYFLAFAVLVDLTTLAISLLNLAKPTINSQFSFGIGILVMSLVMHSLLLFVSPKLSATQNKIGFHLSVLLLLVLALTGNVLSALAGYLLFQTRQPIHRNSVLANITRHEVAMFGLYVITAILSLALTSYWTFDYSYAVENNYAAILQAPNWTYPLGTDNFGRDVFSRLIFGGRISLLVGLLATFVPLSIGGFLGAVAGYYSQRIDQTIMRLLDILYAIPGILLAITIVTAFGSSTQNLILALSIGGIPGYARTMRASVLQVKQMEYIEAAHAVGVSDAKIILKHVLPNASAPMIIRSSLTVATAVISTSSLSYLGLGVESHIPEWGNILRIGSDYLETHPYLAIYPGLAIIALVLSFNFLGDGLRDALDPKMKF